MTAVRTPATAMDRLLTAPSTRPICSALAVPTAWEPVPMATPRATGSWSLQILHRAAALRLPTMPVRMIRAPARDPMPPSSVATSAPMALVTLLGIRLAERTGSSFSSLLMAMTEIMEVTEPAVMPQRTARAFFFRVTHYCKKNTEL